jgi:hypothetical protein
MPPALATRKAPAARRQLPNADELLAFAKVLYDGGLQSKHCNSPAKVAVRIVAGMELGLNPIQSVNWIAIINGRAVIWGDAALALVRNSGKLESFEETHEGEGESRVAICRSKRKGDTEVRETRFSVDDARKADLWGKEGPWTQYPDRQLMWRARGWNLRDNFGDVLCGLGIAEEELDVPVPVKVEKVTPNAASTSQGARPATSSPVEGEMACPQDLLERIGEARLLWLTTIGVSQDDDTAVRKEWTAKLASYGVTSARQLAPDKAEQLLNELLNSEVKPPSGDPAVVFGGAAGN